MRDKVEEWERDVAAASDCWRLSECAECCSSSQAETRPIDEWMSLVEIKAVKCSHTLLALGNFTAKTEAGCDRLYTRTSMTLNHHKLVALALRQALLFFHLNLFDHLRTLLELSLDRSVQDQ